jgi:hypothetical protein
MWKERPTHVAAHDDIADDGFRVVEFNRYAAVGMPRSVMDEPVDSEISEVFPVIQLNIGFECRERLIHERLDDVAHEPRCFDQPVFTAFNPVTVRRMDGGGDPPFPQQFNGASTVVCMPVCVQDEGDVGQTDAESVQRSEDFFPFAGTPRVHKDFCIAFYKKAVGDGKFNGMDTDHFSTAFPMIFSMLCCIVIIMVICQLLTDGACLK